MNLSDLRRVAEAEKKCGHCQEVKPLDQFHKSKKSSDKHHSLCKQCRIFYNSPRSAKWNKENRKEYLANLKAWQIRSRDKNNSVGRAKYKIVKALTGSAKLANVYRGKSIMDIAALIKDQPSPEPKET